MLYLFNYVWTKYVPSLMLTSLTEDSSIYRLNQLDYRGRLGAGTAPLPLLCHPLRPWQEVINGGGGWGNDARQGVI